MFLNEGGEAYAYRTGMALLKRDALIDMHDSGTFFRFTEKGERAAIFLNATSSESRALRDI